MKALTVRQPFATLLVAGVKRYETRTMMTRHRGLLAIHAGLGKGRIPEGVTHKDDLVIHQGVAWPAPRGYVLGTVVVVDCVPTDYLHDLDDEQRELGNFAPGRFAWVVEHPRLFGEPIPATGKLGMWDWAYTL